MFEITRKFLIGSLAAFLIHGAIGPADAQPFAPSRFTVEVRGEGEDVILIPGLGSSREVWEAQAEALAATHRLHLVQINGFAGQPVGAPAGQVLIRSLKNSRNILRRTRRGGPRSSAIPWAALPGSSWRGAILNASGG